MTALGAVFSFCFDAAGFGFGFGRGFGAAAFFFGGGISEYKTSSQRSKRRLRRAFEPGADADDGVDVDADVDVDVVMGAVDPDAGDVDAEFGAMVCDGLGSCAPSGQLCQ